MESLKKIDLPQDCQQLGGANAVLKKRLQYRGSINFLHDTNERKKITLFIYKLAMGCFQRIWLQWWWCGQGFRPIWGSQKFIWEVWRHSTWYTLKILFFNRYFLKFDFVEKSNLTWMLYSNSRIRSDMIVNLTWIPCNPAN